MKYSDRQRIEKMAETCGKLLAYIAENHLTTEQILSQEPLRWAITTPLYNIGEQAYQLTDAYKESHADIPWGKISGLRHRLVHDYENTNWTLICAILFTVLPEFQRQINKIIEQEHNMP